MDLISCSRKGLIPGPNQTEAQFIQKIRALTSAPHVDFSDSLALTHRLFHVEPDWISFTSNNKGLAAWEGAATWQEQTPEGFSLSHIQIRKDFKTFFLQRFYPFSEVLAHEIVHAVRSDFEEDVFEEILAYQTSSCRWRKYLGPLFQRSWETQAFLVSFVLALGLQWGDILFSLPAWCTVCIWLPWAALAFGLSRLARNQAVFRRCLKRLGEAIGDASSSLAVALRLTDEEIRLFARSLPEEIRAYALREKEKTLRWKMIALVYLSSCSDEP